MKEIGEEMTVIREQRVRIDRSEVEGEGVFPNPSAPPASCPEVALPDSQDNLEVTSEVSEGCVDICCGCDSRYKWYDDEGKGLCCLFLFHFPFLVIFLSILAAITYFLYWYIIDWYTSSSCCVLRTLTGVSDSDATPESFPKHEFYDLFSQLYYSINPPSSRKQANSYNAKMTTPKIT